MSNTGKSRRRALMARLLTATTALLAAGWMAMPATAQENKPNPIIQPPATEIPQLPRVATPPTPLPKNQPKSAPLGVSDKEEPETNAFDRKVRIPGQPQSEDPAEITDLEQALSIAFGRNPQILLAVERAYRTEKNVASLNANARPQVVASIAYSQLLNSQSGFGGGAVNTAPGSTSPYPVGLTVSPPGSSPVSLSGGASSNAGGQGAAGQAQSGADSGAASGIRRSVDIESGGNGRAPADSGGGTTRQTDTGTTTTTTTGTGTTSSGGFGGEAPLGQSSARISVSQAIDINGLIKTTRDLGDIERVISRLDVARIRQEIALSVRNGYYSVLRAQAFVRVNEAAVSQSQELLRVTRAQFDAGVASQFDVLRARTQLENNRQALITSRNQVQIARNTLAGLLGIDPSTPVRPNQPEIPPMPDLDEAKLVEMALTQRAEILQADANILKAERNIRLSKRGLLPSLNVVGSGAYNITQQNFGSERVTGSISLQLSWPLSDGGATRSNIRAAVSDERGAYIQKDQFVRGVKSEVQQSVIAVRDANERFASTRATVEQARESLRLAGVRFQAGVGTQLEVNDAQTQLTQAETNDVNAQYDFLGALARLRRVLGNPE